MTVDYELLGRNIKYYRNKKRMKQAELAEAVNVTTEHISHVECSRTKPSLSTLLTIAQALDTDIYTLIGMENPNIRQDTELAAVLRGADPAERKLCLELCRTALQFSTQPPKV